MNNRLENTNNSGRKLQQQLELLYLRYREKKQEEEVLPQFSPFFYKYLSIKLIPLLFVRGIKVHANNFSRLFIQLTFFP